MNRTFNFILAAICCGTMIFATQATSQYTLTVEASSAVHVEGNTVYRFYVNMLDPTDKFSAVYGNDQDPLVLNTPDGIFNSIYNASWSASGINPAFLGIFPEMAEDSYATVGLNGPAVSPQSDPSLVEDNALSPTISSYFVAGGTALNVNSITGGSWYVLNTAANALPGADLRVLVMQITTSGTVSGTINYQVFPLGVGADQVQISVDFDGAGIYVEPVPGCTDSTACNYDAGATTDDGTCTVNDECGECGGNDSSCVDACGVPNGDDSTCTGCMTAIACNYDSTATISDFTLCEYDSCTGCTDDTACNFDPAATLDDGSHCIFFAIGECDCDGNVLDECGVCGGAGIPDGDCDCAGNILDECGVCDGGGNSVECWDGSSACSEVDCAATPEFSPTVGLSLDNLTESGTSSLTYTMSQDNGESEILSSSIVSDGGSFNLSGLAVDDVIGSGTLSLSLFAGNFYIESDLTVSNITNDNYTVFNQVTASNSPVYPVGSIAGGFVISNTGSGVSVYTEIPVDEDYITEAYDMSLTFDDLFVNPSGGELTFTSTLTAELGDVDEQPFVFQIETLDFTPAVNMTLDNLTESGTSSLTYTMSQGNGESEIFSSSVVSDGGSFNLSGLAEDDVIGSGTLSLFLFAGNFNIESDLVVTNIDNDIYHVFNQVTASNSPVYPIGSIAGGFVISNTASGISIYTEIPVDEDYITEAYDMSLTFDDLFVNPSGGALTFTSTLTAELGDVDEQPFVFQIETLDFTPTVNMTLDNLTESGTSSLTYTMSQGNGESEIFSSSVVSDGGSFNLSGLAEDDVIGSGTLSLFLFAGNFNIESDLVVTNIDNDIYHVFNQVTASNSPVYPIGSIAGGFVISNTASGISIYTEIPVDEDYITEAYDMSLTFDDLFVNPSGGDLTFTSTLTAELGDVDEQPFVFQIETLDFTPTVNMTLDNLTESGTSSLTYTMSQGNGESEIFSSSVVSDGGSFNLSGLAEDDVIGSGTLSLFLFAGNFNIESDLVVTNIDNDIYHVFNQVTASNSPVYPVGSIAGGFVISNTASGISIYTEIPVDEDYITEAYDMSLTFDDLFVNPSGGDLTFTSTLTAELGDVDEQGFVFNILFIDGCTDPIACNYSSDAVNDDGSCDYCSCDIIASDAYSLTVESSAAVVAGGTTYRFYVNMTDPTDRMSSVFGHNNSHLIINTPDGAFNSQNNLSWSALGINPLFLAAFPDMADDTYATIGLDGPASASGIAGAADPSLVEDTAQPITPYFLTDGATSLSSTTLIGSSWYILNTAGNGLPNDDLRVLVLQVTTTGDINGTLNYQVFPFGVGANQVQVTTNFDGVGVFVSSQNEYGCGCTDATACNYDNQAIYEDGSCSYISDGDCDCDGNVPDECGVCGGDDSYCTGCMIENTCNYDSEATIPDNDSCDYSCVGCMIPIACNYNPEATINDNSLCEYVSCAGCTDDTACNFDPAATLDDGTHCIFIASGECDCDGNVLDALGVCGGPCAEDCDNDGICDSIDLCLLGCGGGSGCYNPGCMDSENPCYDPEANEDDGSCCLGGCTISVACNYNPDAEYLLPGTCEFTTCVGCTDDTACNYDETATLSNNITCTYPAEYYNCIPECLNDVNENGICDELEILGCMDPDNPGFNPNANVPDPDACLVAGCLIPFACNYDPAADYIDVSLCNFTDCIGCTDESACNYDPLATLSSAALCTFPTNPFRDCNGECYNDSDGDDVCDEQEIAGCTDLLAINFNPFATDDDGTCMILVGGCVIPFACNYDPDADFYDPGSCDFSCLGGTAGMSEAGCTNSYACNYGAEGVPCQFFDAAGDICMIGGCNHASACNYNDDAEYNDGSCEFASCATYGCTLSSACNYNASATYNDGSCDYTSCYGCTNTLSENFDSNATHNDGSCIIHGCTVSAACNYDVTATSENGSCEYASCMNLGCTDLSACNYDSNASINDGSCVTAAYGFDCNGNCTTDLNNNNICDADDIYGCTDANAINFNNGATVNNGTCSYDTFGCTDEMACNFNHQASSDNGSCEFISCYGCMNDIACNFNVEATHPSECTYVSLYEINGATQTIIGHDEVYTYPSTEGSEYIWSVIGGEIVSGLGTNEVIVVWSDASGILTVREISSTGCEGVDVVLNLGSVSSIFDQTVQFSVYPNPANDNIVVVSDLGMSIVTIFDATGRDVYMVQLVNRTNTIDVSNLANGTYRIVADTNDGRRMQTIVISH